MDLGQDTDTKDFNSAILPSDFVTLNAHFHNSIHFDKFWKDEFVEVI